MTHRSRQVFTDAISVPAYHQDLDRYRITLNNLLNSIPSSRLPNDFDSVLELSAEDGVIICGYYLVNHDSRSIFWLEGFQIPEEFNEARGIHSPSHYSEHPPSWSHHSVIHLKNTKWNLSTGDSRSSPNRAMTLITLPRHHCEMFPVRPIPPQVSKELQGILVYGICSASS